MGRRRNPGLHRLAQGLPALTFICLTAVGVLLAAGWAASKVKAAAKTGKK
jgi:hypothetical protein